MQCTLTADTPSWLFTLALGLGAVAVGLCAEAFALGLALRWRGSLAQWGWALAFPSLFAFWCLLCAASLWQLNQALLASGQTAMGDLIEYCDSLSARPLAAEMTLAVGLVALAIGIVTLFLLPSRGRAARRAPAWPTLETMTKLPTTSASSTLPFTDQTPTYRSRHTTGRTAAAHSSLGRSDTGATSRVSHMGPAFGALAGPTQPLSRESAIDVSQPSLPPLPPARIPATLSMFGIDALPTRTLIPSGA